IERPKLTTGGLREELGALRTALLCCEREHVIDHAPWVELPPRGQPRERWLLESEIAKILAHCERRPHLRLFTILALCTGARMGAILGLDWERVDLERRVIDYHDPKRPKTKKGRAVVPINDALHAALVAARPNPATGPVIRWGGQRIKDIRKSLVKAAK